MSPVQDEYKVSLDVFEGPLDLLLYLIRREEVDIRDIPIERITTQYLQYLDLMRLLDLNIAGEFLVMAATLMMIKSRMLLPPDERPEEEAGEEDDVDPRWDLVRQLVEYKKFKDAARHLQQLEEGRLDAFGREGDAVALGPAPDRALPDVGLFDLIGAFQQALRRAPAEDLREIFAERFTVGEQIDWMLERLRTQPRMRLGEWFAGMRSRQEIVVTFLALLELMRLGRIAVRQNRPFGDIFVEPSEA